MASGEDKERSAQRRWQDKLGRLKIFFSRKSEKNKSSRLPTTELIESGTEPSAGSGVPMRVRLNDDQYDHRKSYRRSRVPSVSATRCINSLDLPSPPGYDEARVQGSQESLHRFVSLEGLDVHEQQPLTESIEQPYSGLQVTVQPSAEVTHSDLFSHQVVTTAEDTVDTAGPPPPLALEPPSLDDDKPHPEQDIAIVPTGEPATEEVPTAEGTVDSAGPPSPSPPVIEPTPVDSDSEKEVLTTEGTTEPPSPLAPSVDDRESDKESQGYIGLIPVECFHPAPEDEDKGIVQTIPADAHLVCPVQVTPDEDRDVTEDVPTADVTAEGTVDTAGPPPSPALEPPSLDDDKPHPEQDIAISTNVVVQPALSHEETPEQASGPSKIVPSIAVSNCKSEEELRVVTNEEEIRVYVYHGSGVGRLTKYPPNEYSMCMPP